MRFRMEKKYVRRRNFVRFLLGFSLLQTLILCLVFAQKVDVAINRGLTDIAMIFVSSYITIILNKLCKIAKLFERG